MDTSGERGISEASYEYIPTAEVIKENPAPLAAADSRRKRDGSESKMHYEKQRRVSCLPKKIHWLELEQVL